MNSTIEHNGDSATQSLSAAWQHFQQMWSASSKSEAWSACKRLLEAMPAWGYIAGMVLILALIANSWIIVIPAAAGGFLVALYVTVKQAVLSALRTHDAEQQE